MAGTTDPVAVIGTGGIGRAVALRLLDGGHDVVVWNRSPGRIAELVARGARPAGSVAEALACPLALFAVPDPAAVEDCLARVPGDLRGRTVVALCTATPREARSTAERAADLGARYLQAGIQAPAEQMGTDDALLLFSGSPEAFEDHRAVLASLGRALFVGAAAEAAPVWDLALFGLWYDAQLGVLRALRVAGEAGVDLDAFAESAGIQLGFVVSGLPGTLSEFRAGEHPPGPADLRQHLDLVRRLVGFRAGAVLGDGGLADVVRVLETVVGQGRGSEGLTAIA